MHDKGSGSFKNNRVNNTMIPPTRPKPNRDFKIRNKQKGSLKSNNKGGYKSPNPGGHYDDATPTGKERPDHKYVKKVRTKNGKIRYIYEADLDKKESNENKNTNTKNQERIAKKRRKGLEKRQQQQEIERRRAQRQMKQEEAARKKQNRSNEILRRQQANRDSKQYRTELKQKQNKYKQNMQDQGRAMEKRYIREKYGNSLASRVVGRGLETAKAALNSIKSKASDTLSSVRTKYKSASKKGRNWLINKLNI